MSKSLGNSPDLLKLIEDYGADATRFGVLISSPAGNDLLFDEGTLEQGKLFANKIWNALKLLQILNEKEKIEANEIEVIFPSTWFQERLHEVQRSIEQDLKEFRLSEALKKIYSLIWDDYCSWYLEWIKTAPDQPISKHNMEQAFHFFESLMKLLHPFMPFLTEEVYHALKTRTAGDDLMVSSLKDVDALDENILKQGDLLKTFITAIRDLKVKQGLKPKDEVTLYLPDLDSLKVMSLTLKRQCAAKEVHFMSNKPETATSFTVAQFACGMESEKEVDNTQQIEQMKKDLSYYQGFLLSIDKKLSNERFVQNAKPEVVDMELKKKNDALEKIRVIEESLKLLQ
jgi:valyl-tRNA synthetase